MEQYLLPILLVAGIIFFIIYRKNKKKKQALKTASMRKEKDEVWNTIKLYIRERHNNSFKGEIANHYVAKRNDLDYISPHLSSFLRKKKRAEIDIRRMQNGKNKENDLNKRELYVVCFQTRDTKTHVYNPPEAFECEVVRQKISKTETTQKIVITKGLNFFDEMEWIAPLRSIEQEKKIRNEKIMKKAELKNQQKQAKKKNKKK